MTDSVERQTPNRRDLLALQTVLGTSPELFVDATGEPRIGLPLVSTESLRLPWSLRHPRVKAEIANLVFRSEQIILFEQEILRILTILEGQAWRDQRLDIEIRQALDDVPLVEALYIYLHQQESQGFFCGSCTKLLHALTKTAHKAGVDLKSASWPKGAAQLSRRLGQLEPLLEKAGIIVKRKRESGGTRSVEIRSNLRSGDATQPPSPPPLDANSKDFQTIATPDGSDALSSEVFDRIKSDSERKTNDHSD
ncbi:MAG: hypothetical protein ACR2FY_21820 [Pirellulaceae bacterium]